MKPCHRAIGDRHSNDRRSERSAGKPAVTQGAPDEPGQEAYLQTAGREKVNRSGFAKKLLEGRTCFRSGPKDHALYRLCDFGVVFQSRLQSIEDSVAG